MVGIAATPDRAAVDPRGERGFSLVEVLTAMIILTVGLLPLVGLFSTSVQRMTASTPMLVAREKAREAIESVHAARDTGQASWPTIQNVSAGGVFLDGARTIMQPGNDGLVNTADDGAVELPAAEFTREIQINPLNLDVGGALNPNLREVRVTVRYKVYGAWRSYVMTTYVSSYS
ncbi:MAG TPA: prepilin-type N-terminal cleavage/methylation domain-containing protein [Vicinamibacterales bacterium]|nr:prepilin-type N-terminal cleavage/methylation domain-containing protein [Vicinamibacterales bacterium]